MPILIAIIGVCIPIVAIVTSHHYKLQKLKVEQGRQNEGAPAQYVIELEKKIDRLASENKELKERMGNVETIIADADFLLPASRQDESKATTKKIAEMANRDKNV